MALDARLPHVGRALELAAGTGRNGLWLATRGLEVTLADTSAVGLGLARDHARARGLCVSTVTVDLEAEPAPAGPWDVVVCTCFLNRALLRRVQELLGPTGWFILVHPTRTNLQQNAKPSPRFLLEDGEAITLLSALELVIAEESWDDWGRHTARVLATTRSACATSPPVERERTQEDSNPQPPDPKSDALSS